ncbi:MAG TPA: S1C family serine protease [Treponemataceae bacterium]|nr:S1C family serine protease [Treponemataceae bacterium]
MSKRALSGITLAFVFCSISFVGCASQQKREPFVDYSSERSVLHEVDQARLLLDKDPLIALARARTLKDNTSGLSQVDSLYADAETKTRAEFDAAVSKGDWSGALVLFRSLDALSAPPEGWTADKIIANRVKAWKEEGNTILAGLDSVVRSTPEDEAPSSRVVAQMIQGTVTVWVDRGLRVEAGVGYADRVIGSAFFIDPRGYLITNCHVIDSEVNPKYEGYSRLFIKMPNDPDTRIPAKVIGWDPVLDLALVKTEITPPAVFQLGTSEDLKVGNKIYAIGSPVGLEQTLTSGIVSAQKRRLLSLGDVLQIDAPINHGNSGGPIVDEAGRVQAVVFAGIEPYEGLNFAIPIEYLRIILPALYAGGKVTHPWLGAFGKTAVLPGSSANSGVTLVYAVPGSPCELAGIAPGTVITEFNGKPVHTLEELQSLLIREAPKTIVKLTGLTGVASGQEKATPVAKSWFVQLFERPEVPGKVIFDRDIESRALLPIAGFNLERVGASRKYVVKSVVRGSVADESGFSEQDVLEIRDVAIDEKNESVAVQLYTKRRKSGYLDSFIGFQASLDSPSYF